MVSMRACFGAVPALMSHILRLQSRGGLLQYRGTGMKVLIAALVNFAYDRSAAIRQCTCPHRYGKEPDGASPVPKEQPPRNSQAQDAARPPTTSGEVTQQVRRKGNDLRR